ncbi:hypothetical protein [Amycolatopsis tolypomycina]|uniref:Uncharacterized protein n=1 Tax=Amycolatopsis tolypomycina TaxID=208445 RepID=A0A1H4TCZ5_9PSEU|nr:hypothetical protein [Amycolatopsis tolypomycina]SEC54326.1 hypothetical protein SAMN04489727_4138 [Amycolatopsis tolypomycina]
MNAKTANRNIAGSEARAALGTVKSLVTCYLVLSVLTLGAIVLMRNNPDLVTDAVWIRGSIVAVTAFLMLSFASGAAKGNPRALLRLRLVSAIMVVVIAVIIALPGGFPTWMKIEQAVCGVLLLGVVGIANGKRVRSAFAK